MKLRCALSIIGVIAICFILTGCGTVYPYDEYYSFAATRNIADSTLPEVTKICAVPVTFIPEILMCSFTSYMDAYENHADLEAQDGHVYLSYMGLRVMKILKWNPKFRVAASVPVFVIDTVFLPVTGVVDVCIRLSEGS